jgi:hypothetical protein
MFMIGAPHPASANYAVANYRLLGQSASLGPVQTKPKALLPDQKCPLLPLNLEPFGAGTHLNWPSVKHTEMLHLLKVKLRSFWLRMAPLK